MARITRIVALIIILVGFVLGMYLASTYSMNATVINYEGKKCFKDSTGNVWSDDRAEDYDIDDEVRITFSMNSTDNIREDDVIEHVKKIEKTP